MFKYSGWLYAFHENLLVCKFATVRADTEQEARSLLMFRALITFPKREGYCKHVVCNQQLEVEIEL